MEAKDIVKKFLVSGEIASQPRDVVALKIAKASFAAGKQEGIMETANSSSELLEVGRKAIEKTLLEWRDNRLSEFNRGNGLVIREKDGKDSNIIRFGSETALRIGMKAIGQTKLKEQGIRKGLERNLGDNKKVGGKESMKQYVVKTMVELSWTVEAINRETAFGIFNTNFLEEIKRKYGLFVGIKKVSQTCHEKIEIGKEETNA